MADTEITIIGGGIIGCAIAQALKLDNIVLLERNNTITSENQTSRNSGVIHAGVYYNKQEEPLKTRLCVQGNEMLYAFCQQHNIPHKRTGKLIVATNRQEEVYLDDLLLNCQANGVDARIIEQDEITEKEPNVTATKALLLPSSGIIEPTTLVSRLALLAIQQGVTIMTGKRVVDIKYNGEFIITLQDGEQFTTRQLINAAGLYSDETARLLDPESTYTLQPTKGEAAKFTTKQQTAVKMNVYPVPHVFHPDGNKINATLAEYKRLLMEGYKRTLGVHLTPTLEYDGTTHSLSTTITIGPYNTKPKDKEDYAPTKTPTDFLKKIQPFFPHIQEEDITLHQTGIQARLARRRDWVIERDAKHPNCVHLIGIDSPGLTASLAIAEYVKLCFYSP